MVVSVNGYCYLNRSAAAVPVLALMLTSVSYYLKVSCLNQSLSRPALSQAMLTSLVFLISVTAYTVDSSVPVLPLVSAALGSTDQATQLIVGLFMLGYAMGQIPCGLLLDRFGRRRVILWSLAIFIITGFWSSVTDSIYQLLFARFLQGMAGAIGPVGSRTIIRDIATDQQLPRLMATNMAVLSVATMLAPVIGSVLAMLTNWRAPFWSAVVFGIVTFVLAWRYIPRITLNEERHKRWYNQLAFSLRVYFNSPQSVWSATLLTIFFSGYMAIVAGGSTVLVGYYGLSPLWCGYLYTFSAFTYVVGAVFNRRLLKTYSALRALKFAMGSLVISSIGFVYMSTQDHIGLVPLWGLTSVYTFAMGFVLANTNTISLAPITQAKGFVASITGTAQVLGGAAGAMLCAQIYDGTFHALTYILSVTGLLALVVYQLRNYWVKAFVL